MNIVSRLFSGDVLLNALFFVSQSFLDKWSEFVLFGQNLQQFNDERLKNDQIRIFFIILTM